MSQRTWSGGPQTSLSSGVWLHLGFAAVFVGVGAILNASNSVFANRGYPHGRPNPHPHSHPKPKPKPNPTPYPYPYPYPYHYPQPYPLPLPLPLSPTLSRSVAAASCCDSC